MANDDGAVCVQRRRRRGPSKVVAVALVCAVLAASCWKPSLTPDYSFTVIDDLVYGQGEIDNDLGGGVFTDLVLDLYVPDVPGQTVFPLMILFHGGGFRQGTEERAPMIPWAEAYASHGYMVASIDYRLEFDYPVPSSRVQPLFDAIGGFSASLRTIAAVAAIDDALTAIDFLHARPDVEPYQTVLSGLSAGGIIALYVGYGLDDYGIERGPVAAVLDNAGGFGWADTPGDAATLIDGAASQVGRSDPLYLYKEPPLYVVHGNPDTSVSFSYAQQIIDQAALVGLPIRTHIEPGGGHGPDIFTTMVAPGVSVFQDQINWLDSILVGVTDTSTTTTSTTTSTTTTTTLPPTTTSTTTTTTTSEPTLG